MPHSGLDRLLAEIDRDRADAPATLPIGPKLTGLSIEYVDMPGVELTFIARKFDRPEACQLCPGLPCMHLRAGFCLVVVEAIVPRKDCPGFVLNGGGR